MSYSAVSASLLAAGWLPDNADCCFEEIESLGNVSASGNLFDWLDRIWRSRLACRGADPRRRHWRCLSERVAQLREQGAWLSYGLPESTACGDNQAGWAILRSCVLFWPRGIPRRPWVGIVSSRLGRRLDQRGDWFDAFRCACHVARENDAVLLTSDGTTTAHFTAGAAQGYDLRSLRIRTPRPRDATAKWLRRLRTMSRDAPSSTSYEVWLSPPATGNTQFELPTVDAVVPLRDQAVAALADQLYVPHLRRGGNIERLVRSCLSAINAPTPRVFIAREPRLVAPDLLGELKELGAVELRIDDADFSRPLIVAGDRGPSTTQFTVAGTVDGGASSTTVELTCGSKRCPTPFHTEHRIAEIMTSLPRSNWSYLTHCTRAATGPWPDQSPADYVAELLSIPAPAERTPRASLYRIVEQRRIVATSRGIRGGAKVVCFTEVSLSDLATLRVFRPHRGRWDFEPYGICLGRDWLEQSGTRAVIYGDNRVWWELDESLRPFFQRSTSRGKRGQQIYDWTVEREWRHVGDVALDAVPAESVVVLVPDENEALALSSRSPWPILVLSQYDQGRGAR